MTEAPQAQGTAPMTTKFYSSASNVRRAVKTAATKAKVEPVSVAVTAQTTEENVKAFVGHVVLPAGTSAEVAAMFSDFEVRVVEAAPRKEKPAKAPRAPKAAHVNESAVEKPVAVVHSTAQAMFDKDPTVTRKAILEACRAKGVATHTAATQYARWRAKMAK